MLGAVTHRRERVVAVVIDEYTHEELIMTGGELLPCRQALSLVNLNINVAIPTVVAINPAIAFNVLTISSSATAIAGQLISLGL